MATGSESPRRWGRHETTVPVSLVLRGNRFTEDKSAVTLNVSVTGACVRTTLALLPGEWVGVVIKREFPHAIPSRVVWTREDAVTRWWYAGLEFFQASEHTGSRA